MIITIALGIVLGVVLLYVSSLALYAIFWASIGIVSGVWKASRHILKTLYRYSLLGEIWRSKPIPAQTFKDTRIPSPEPVAVTPEPNGQWIDTGVDQGQGFPPGTWKWVEKPTA